MTMVMTFREKLEAPRQRKWDLRYLDLAKTVSSWSKDPSTKTGAVIVRENNTVAGLGFNGFPQGMNDDPAIYANREEKYSRVVHCEVNATIFGAGPYTDCTLYTWPLASCDRCIVQMIQNGIRRFVFPAASKDQITRWGPALEKSMSYAREVGAEIVEIPREELGLES